MIHRIYSTVQRPRPFAFPRVAWSALVSCAVGVVWFASPTVVQAQATFTPLGLFGGAGSRATDVSADGSVIVGTIALPGPDASVFRVTPQGATVRPTGLIGSEFSTEVSVSADGSTVVGTFQSPRGEEAFRWIGDGPFEGLGDLPGGAFESNAFGVSADGSVVVGTSEPDSRPTAFRWIAASGMVSLGGNERSARAVSADGSVVVGSVTGDVSSSAYRWTAQTGSMILPPLPRPRFPAAEARAVTGDGSVVVGFNELRIGLSGTTNEAFRWTEQEGTVSLQSGGWNDTVAWDVSGDGSAVVGAGITPPATTGGRAFYWTAETGILDLRELLIFGGATNLDGWRFLTAQGISQDGLTVVGTALHEQDGRREAFVATIGAIPEPSTLILAALAVLLLFAFCLHQRVARGGR